MVALAPALRRLPWLRLETVLIAFSLLAVMAFGFVLGMIAWHGRLIALDNARSVTENLAVAAETATAQDLLSVDAMLAAIGDMLNRLPPDRPLDGPDAAGILHGFNEQNFAVSDVLLLDNTGQRIADDTTTLSADVSLVDHDFFRRYVAAPDLDVALRDKADRMVPALGHPERAVPEGPWSVYMAHPVSLRGGRFTGLLVAVIPIRGLAEAFRKLEGKAGTELALIAADGTLVVSEPSDTVEIGAKVPKDGAFGTRVLATTRYLPTRGLRVEAAMPAATALQGWREHVDEFGAIFFLGSTACIGFTGFIVVLLRRQRRAQTMLQDAIEQLEEGFVLYDDADRLVMCNRRYRELYARTTGAIATGWTFEKILRAAVAEGEFGDVGPDPELWIAARLEERKSAYARWSAR